MRRRPRGGRNGGEPVDEWAQAMRRLVPGSELSTPDRRAFEALDSAAGRRPSPAGPPRGRAVDLARLPPLGANLEELSPAELGILPEVADRARRIAALCGLPFARVARDPGLSLMPEFGLPGTVAFAFHPARRPDGGTGGPAGGSGPATELREVLVGAMGRRLLPAVLRAGGLDVRPGGPGGEELVWGVARPLAITAPPSGAVPAPVTARPGAEPGIDPRVLARVRLLARLCALPFTPTAGGTGLRLTPELDRQGHRTGRSVVGYQAPPPLGDAAAEDPDGPAAGLLRALAATADDLLLALLPAAGLDARRDPRTLLLVVHGVVGPPPQP
ncbi:hypothetical protein [Kitasatospora sp. NPDC088346]|uniref:hypothetical protein n=1 Tax=Kitasatospora sp. NPDC088346 TaxID=3364073 RepID=UPI0038112619